jgi:hypothetical protein
MRARVARDNAGKHYSAVENVQGKARSAPIFRLAQHNANAGAMVPACFKSRQVLLENVSELACLRGAPPSKLLSESVHTAL